MVIIMHLTTDEILNFVTMESITKENILLSAHVNSHIMKCEECRNKVIAYQAVNDGLTGTVLSVPQLENTENVPELEIEMNLI